MSARATVSVGAVMGFVAVAAGAFGAHGLRETLEPRMLAAFETGADYAMVHALALVLTGLLATRAPSRAATVAAIAFAAGVVLFSGSLWVMAISGVKALGIITPFGGLAFMVGWIALAVSARALGAPQEAS